MVRVFEKILGSNSTVALFDDNMVLVKPVYDFLCYQKEIGKEPNTLVGYAYDLKTFWGFLSYNGLNFNQVTPETISNFIVYLREPFHHKEVVHLPTLIKNYRKATTINRILGTVYRFYVHCNWVLNMRNPVLMEEVERPPDMFHGFFEHARQHNRTIKSYFKVKNRKEKKDSPELMDEFRILSSDDCSTIIGALSSRRDRLLFKVLLWSGMRISEALSLTIQDIPIPDNSSPYKTVWVKEAENVDRRQQLKSGSRKVYLPTQIIKELDDFIMEERYTIDTEHDFLFVSAQSRLSGKVLTQEAVRDKYKKLSQKLGISPFTPHSLRHTCCTNLIAAGVPITTVQKVMGHRQISTTQKYIHLADEHIIGQLDKYWKQSVFWVEE